MFILKSKEQLSKAIENAKALHPKVRRYRQLNHASVLQFCTCGIIR